MKSLQKTLLIAGGTVIGIAVAGGMFAYQDGKIGAFSDDTVQAAIEAKTYSALSTEAQAQITEAQFANMVDHQATREAVETAIENNDYDAFVEAADAKMLERVDSQEAFDELVARKQAMQEHKAAIEATVAAGDYDAFVTEMEANRAQMQANKSADTPEKNHDRPELTDEEKQEKFQALVDYYTINGELPDHGHGNHPGGRGMVRGHH